VSGTSAVTLFKGFEVESEVTEGVIVMLEALEEWLASCGREPDAFPSEEVARASRRMVLKCEPQRRAIRRELTGILVPSIARKSMSANSRVLRLKVPRSFAAELSIRPKSPLALPLMRRPLAETIVDVGSVTFGFS
jgi:hypothetical protein